MRLVEHWSDERNARMYDAFARSYPMYRSTSADLVRCVGLESDSHVLDLACGTGVTTEAILEALGPAGRVTAVDASPAMLQIAREQVKDPRVTWLETPAEHISTQVPPESISHATCNSAIWQLDVPAVVATVSTLLVPGGRLACSLGTNRPPDGSAAQPQKPSLHELMRAYAVIDHNFLFQPGRRSGRLMNDVELGEHLQTGGFQVVRTEYVDYPFDAAQTYAWSQIPIFTAHFSGLTYEQRMDALDKAWSKLDPQAQGPSRWAIVVAQRPDPHG